MRLLIFVILALPAFADDDLNYPITAEIYAPTYIAKFKKAVCKGLKADDCNSKLRETFVARLNEQYAGMDGIVVSTKCTAHPIECRDPKTLEQWSVESMVEMQARGPAAPPSAASIIEEPAPTYYIGPVGRDGQPRKPKRKTRCTSHVSLGQVVTDCQGD